MNIKSTLSSRLRNFFSDKKELRPFLPYSIGKRIAYTLPFPTPEINDYKSFYITQCESICSAILSDINEKFLYDVNEAKKVTYAIWNTRCHLAYRPQSIDYLSLLSSAKTGLIAPNVIKQLTLEHEYIEPKTLGVLDLIIDEEIA